MNLQPGCCNKEVTQRKLEGIARPDRAFDADDMTDIGGMLNLSFSCTDENKGIIDTIGM